MKKKRNPVLDALSLVSDLHTLPLVALEVSRLMDDPSTTPAQITEVMKADQVITSKVLRLVNSPYYAIRGGVSTVEKAVRYLGYNTIFQLLIGVSVMEFSKLGGEGGLDVREFWKHSLGVAVASEIIAKRAKMNDPSELFAAGLLHDLGKLALAKVAKKKFGLAIESARKDGISLLIAEKEQGLVTHDKVGSVLAEKWKIPMVLRAVIAQHHLAYENRSQTISKPLQPQVDVVVLANTLCRRFEIGDGGDLVIPDIDKKIVERLGLLQNDLDQMKGEMTRKIEDSKIFLDMLADSL